MLKQQLRTGLIKVTVLTLIHKVISKVFSDLLINRHIKMMNEMNPVEREFKEKMTVNPRITLPILFWEEWKTDCKERFNDTYFLKMKYDHEYVRNFTALTNLLASDYISLQEQFEELKARVVELEQNGMQQEEIKQEAKVRTFGKRD